VDRQVSLTQYYSDLSTDELLFILATKNLTADAKEPLEGELKRRGVSNLDLQVSEFRKEQEQFAEYERRVSGFGTSREFFWTMVMCLGIGLFITAVHQFFYSGSVPYALLLSGPLVFAVGLWMLKRSQRAAGA
jgi:hypothetical protein